jgi:two-component system sensor histidine kinase KdpD
VPGKWSRLSDLLVGTAQPRHRRSDWRTRPVSYGAALGAVAVVSLFIGLVLQQINLANVSMLYLLAVMATAVAFGRGPAIFASVLAFLVFDWFFVAPIHQFTVSDPEEWVSLLFFLLTATVTGQLAAGQRERAREARQREREAVVLYDVVRLLGETDLEHALGDVAERLRAELQLAGLTVELWRPGGEAFRIGAGTLVGTHPELWRPTAARVLQGGRAPARDEHAAPGRWVRVVPPERSARSQPAGSRGELAVVPIRVDERRLGTLLVHPSGTDRFDSADDRLLSAAAGQIGLAVERDRLRKEATEAEILRRTDQLRAALLNAVSHDLRTPLAAIMASAGSLRQRDVAWSEEERQGFAQAIEEEAERLNRLVGNLLDLSRIEGGSLRPEMSWYDLGVLMDDVIERLRPITARHRVRLSVPDDLPPVWLDPVEIGEVLYNLVENAAKYAPPGTEIEIRVSPEPGAVRIEVLDRGPGIPAPALDHLFEPFYRAVDHKPRPKGLGLGLAVVKGLVQAHGGRVWAENRTGGGARFLFTLPATTAPADVPPVPNDALA